MKDTTEQKYNYVKNGKNCEITIGDDGTMDTLVCYKDQEFRYDSHYRFSFDNDAQFLEEIKEEVEEWYARRKESAQETRN